MSTTIRKTTTSVLVIALAIAIVLLAVLYLQPNNASTVSAMDINTEHKEYHGADGSGSGNSEDDPILIGSYNTFNTIIRNRSANSTTFFVLINDIDLSPANVWTPFTRLAERWTLDGNNYSIYNMKYYNGTRFGLFSEISGTIKNLKMGSVNISKVTNSNVSDSGILGYRALNGARFENITLESGIMLSTGNQIGGFVALINGGTVTFKNCYNKIPIESTHTSAGFVSRITGGANVTFEKCANLASVAATRDSSHSITGGFVGSVTNNSTSITFDFCYNLGDIQGYYHTLGGFIGQVNNGTININNSFNDAEIEVNNDRNNTIKGAFTTRPANGGTIHVNNSYYNIDIFEGIACYNGGNVNSDAGKTSNLLRSHEFVSELNTIANQELFELNNGVLGFAVLYEKYTLTFLPGDGDGEAYEMIRNKTDIEIELPHNQMHNYPGLPYKTGFVFSGWQLDDSVYEAGEIFENEEAKDLTFIAKFEKAVFKITFDDTTIGQPVVKIEDSIIAPNFSLGEINKYLDISYGSWTENLRWMIKLAGTSGASDLDWILLSQSQQVQLSELVPEDTTGINFINNYVNYLEDETHAGEIEIKIIDISTQRLLDIATNYIDGGQVTITLQNDQVLHAPLGSIVSLPTSGQVVNITITTNKYYTFNNISLYNNDNEIIGEPINNANYDSSSDERFNLQTQLLSGYKLVVDFEKTQYQFKIYAAVGGQENIKLNEDLIVYNSQPTAISIYENASINVSALPESPLLDYRFVTFKIYSALEDIYYNFDVEAYTYEKEFDSSELNDEWLETHLVDDQFVIIVAEYVEAFAVSITMAEGQSEHGNITIKVIDALTLEEQYFSYMQNIYVVKNSVITIVATAENFHEFDYFLNANANDYVKNNEVVIDVNNMIDISAVFKYKSFEIEFVALDQINHKVNASGFISYINNQENTSSTIKITDTVNGDRFDSGDAVSGYRFINFTIKDEIGETITLTTDFTVTENILKHNLNRFNKFIVNANYISRHTLTLTQPNEHLGTVKVYVNGQQTTTREFDYGTNLEIIASTNRFSKLDENNPIYGYIGNELIDDNALNINITYDRSIVFNFLPLTLNINETLLSSDGGQTTISNTNNLNIGDTITLMVSAQSGKELKDWTINGISINNLPENMKYEANSVSITITEDWLNGLEWRDDETFIIESNAIFGITPAVLLAIIIPSVLIPLLATILIIYYIGLNKRKRKIRAELQQKQAAKYKLNTSDFLKDLREGKNVGQVTDEDVKKAMRKKRKKK